ncbi:hypothetical protein FGO68_gene9255 [Halteria grandinella]|uniref:Uncharacterized protein n=1 Tax=Halteria grandinella TaxID=5974 RepID=A0A8J8T0U9_HALGN|nr:hypothetical protein FGO68_gene9255 [Halteria grandinella]
MIITVTVNKIVPNVIPTITPGLFEQLDLSEQQQQQQQEGTQQLQQEQYEYEQYDRQEQQQQEQQYEQQESCLFLLLFSLNLAEIQSFSFSLAFYIALQTPQLHQSVLHETSTEQGSPIASCNALQIRLACRMPDSY